MGLTGYRTAALALALMLAPLQALPSRGFIAVQSAQADELAVTQPGWTVSQLQGSAKSRNAGMTSDTDWINLDSGASLSPGTEITTAEDGFVILVNGTDRVQIMANSHVQLPIVEQPGVLTRILHQLGTVFFEVGKQPGRQFEVDTPYLVAIVKGTKFSTQVSDAGGWVNVTEGVVGVTARGSSASVDVTPGETATVTAGSNEDVQIGPTPPAGASTAPGNPLQSPASQTSPTSPSAPTDTSSAPSGSGTGSGQSDGKGKGKGNDKGNGNGNGNGNGQGNGHGHGHNDDDHGCKGGGNCNGHGKHNVKVSGKSQTAQP